MFPSHVLALLLVRDANNALTFQKGPGLRQKKTPLLSMQLACRSKISGECFAARGCSNVSLVLFATKCAVAGNVFPRLDLRCQSQFWSPPGREIGHKAGRWRYGPAPAVSRLTFAKNGNT
ncbi:hypothetical protein GCM10011487_30580 [Steroidobacter agaridevorans]|uniref:Uncharacterized protein n=1 Tax=Steroidobacter agaridevorans TaxID=2695856 RepID=A0A829YDX7_9GAMM|nr:hypothetical protein GCM10011487_30580 [Steroidobacter agaridevorans]